MNYGKGWEGTHEEIALNIMWRRRFAAQYSNQWLLPKIVPIPEYFFACQGYSTPLLKPEKWTIDLGAV